MRRLRALIGRCSAIERTSPYFRTTSPLYPRAAASCSQVSTKPGASSILSATLIRQRSGVELPAEYRSVDRTALWTVVTNWTLDRQEAGTIRFGTEGLLDLGPGRPGSQTNDHKRPDAN
jgi:hypothetical protein